MAADTRCTTGGPFYHAPKVFRVGLSLFGTAGHGSLCNVLLDWLRSPRNRLQLYKQIPDDMRDEVQILELGPGGLLIWDGWGAPDRLIDKCYALGTGASAALDAMEHGATPEEAIHRGMKRDECTGGEVQVEYLLPKELLPKRKRRR